MLEATIFKESTFLDQLRIVNIFFQAIETQMLTQMTVLKPNQGWVLLLVNN